VAGSCEDGDDIEQRERERERGKCFISDSAAEVT
jgi:hypothetical protein